MVSRVPGNISCDLDPKVKGQILNFLVNASPPKAFDIVTSNSKVHRSHDVEGTGQQFV